MKIHTTNYLNTFIQIADDCPAATGEAPPMKGDQHTVASLQFELISKHPYQLTSDDVLFQVFAHKNDLTEVEHEEARIQLFSKGQACLRASPLTKRYGWGIHHDAQGKVALFGAESPSYQEFLQDSDVKKVKAMKSSR